MSIPLFLEINAPLYEERAKYNGIIMNSVAKWTETYCWSNADFVLPVTVVLANIVTDCGADPEKVIVIP